MKNQFVYLCDLVLGFSNDSIFSTMKVLAKYFFIGVSLLLMYSSLAQEQDSISLIRHLDKITVTAQKQEQNLQEIPVAVSHLTRPEEIRERIWKTQDLSGVFPNLYMGNPGDGRNAIGIRGIATTSYDPAVAVYVDGVIQFDMDAYTDGMQDIERIEVLRGPQGTLYGRNAMGGVINILTRQPTNETKATAGVDVGNHGLWKGNLGVRTALIPGRLFLGLSGQYETSNGYFKNEFNDSPFDKKHRIMGNYYLKYLTLTNWTFTFNYKHSNSRNHGAFTLAPSIDEAMKNPFKVSQNSLTRMRDDVTNASLNIRHQGNIDFSSQTSFQSNYLIYEDPIDGDFSPLDIVSIVNNYGKDWNKVDVITQEIRFSSSPSNTQKFSWLAGAFGYYRHDPVKQGTYFGEDAAIYGADPFMTMITTNTGRDLGGALFGQAEYSLTDRLNLVAGVRYDRERAKLKGRSELEIDGMDPIVIHPDTTGQGTYHAISPKGILSYKINPDHLLFFSYSRGFRAGGISEVSEDPSEPALQTFDPEFSDNFEIGLKNEFFNHKVRWNLSAFYTRVHDIQVPQMIMPEALVVTRNEGKLSSKGIESELTALIGRGVTLQWNGGLTQAKFTDLQLAGDEGNKNLSGNRQLFTPDFTSHMMAQYERKLGNHPSFRMMARLEWLWLGTTYFDLANTMKQDPYHLLKGQIGVKRNSVGLSFWAKNILDIRYIDYAYEFGAAHMGDPATYGVSLRYDL